MLILLLPDVLLSDVVSQWLDFKSFTNFDSSLTNHKARDAHFESIISISAFLYDCVASPDVLKYLLSRDIALVFLEVSDLTFDWTEPNYEIILKLNLSKVRRLDIHNPSIPFPNLVEIINKCPELRELSMSLFDKETKRDQLIKINTNILNQITTLHDMSCSDLDIVGDYFTGLSSISLRLDFLTVEEKNTIDFMKLLLTNNSKMASIKVEVDHSHYYRDKQCILSMLSSDVNITCAVFEHIQNNDSLPDLCLSYHKITPLHAIVTIRSKFSRVFASFLRDTQLKLPSHIDTLKIFVLNRLITNDLLCDILVNNPHVKWIHGKNGNSDIRVDSADAYRSLALRSKTVSANYSVVVN
jgi:hypothetical protein